MSTNLIVVAAAIVLVGLFLLFGWYYAGRPGVPQATMPQSGQPASTEAEGGRGGDAATAAKREEEGEPDAETAGVVPTFDTVRVEPSGEAVIAGRAEPGATVNVHAGSEQIGQVVADATGAWAFVTEKPLPSGASDLWISAEKGGTAVRSKQSLAVVVDPEGARTPLVVVQDEAGSRVLQEETEVAATAPAQAGSDAASGPAATTPDMQAGGTGDKPAEAAGDTPAESAGAAPAAPSGTAATPAATPQVSIEAADYEAGGGLLVSGTAPPGATVRVYYDNTHLGDAASDGDGRWQLSAERPLDGATHALRADLIGTDGSRVAARAEVSFIAEVPGEKPAEVAAAGSDGGQKPAGTGETAGSDMAGNATAGKGTTAGKPDQPAQAGGMPGAMTAGEAAGKEMGKSEPGAAATPATPATPAAGQGPRRITVKRGDNLWRISRSIYGRGIRYTTIYKANQDQIRNPHWIYPGQVFIVPRRVGNDGAATDK